MSNIVNFPEQGRIQEQAAYWLVKLDQGALTSDDSAALQDWLDSDPRHKEALVELAGLWDDMDVIAQLSELFPLTQTQSGHSDRLGQSILKSPVWPAAAVLMLAVIVTAFFLKPAGVDVEIAQPTQAESVFETSVGEQRDVTLPDGSVTKLNTDSRIKLAFTDERRKVRLIKGEAHFKVTKDNNRPFVVHAGTGTIRAVGTAFNVRLKREGVEVTVSEGRVEIASASDSGDETFFDFDVVRPAKYQTVLEAGQRAEYDNLALHSVESVGAETLSRELSWQHGMLVFKGEVLEEVVEEISRYTRTEIIISDPKIRNIRIGGYFKTGEIDSLLTVLKDNFPIKVDRVHDHLVYLRGEKVVQAEN